MTNTITKITYDGEDYKVGGSDYTAGTGISISASNEISNSGVTSFNGSTGAVTYTAPVTSVNGSTGAVTVSEFSPSGTATTGYVVTKTAGGYEWAAPTGGISNVTTGTTTTVSGIWAGTEAEYALITPSADVIYFCFPS